MAEDEEGKHSRHVCYTCVSKMRPAKSNSVGAVKSARLSRNNSSHNWCHFEAGDVSACSVCAHRIVLSFGTIKNKKAVQNDSCEMNINENEHGDIFPDPEPFHQPNTSSSPVSTAVTPCKSIDVSSSTSVTMKRAVSPPTPSIIMKDSSTEMTPQKTSRPLTQLAHLNQPWLNVPNHRLKKQRTYSIFQKPLEIHLTPRSQNKKKECMNTPQEKNCFRERKSNCLSNV